MKFHRSVSLWGYNKASLTFRNHRVERTGLGKRLVKSVVACVIRRQTGEPEILVIPGQSVHLQFILVIDVKLEQKKRIVKRDVYTPDWLSESSIMYNKPGSNLAYPGKTKHRKTKADME